MYKNKFILLALVAYIFLGYSFVHAVAVPSCSMSYTPSTIKQGEISMDTWRTHGPLSSTSMTCTGVLSYMSFSEDFTGPEFLNSINAQELIDGTSNSGKIKPSRIGTGTCTWIVRGPGGTNSCTATISVVPNNSTLTTNEVIPKDLIIFPLSDSEKIYSCAATKCEMKRSPVFSGNVLLLKTEGDWYEIGALDRKIDVGGNLVSSELQNAWVHLAEAPQNIVQGVKTEIPATYTQGQKEGPSSNIAFQPQTNEQTQTKNFSFSKTYVLSLGDIWNKIKSWFK